MILLISVILFCSALSDWAAAKDWESSERNAERRHEELMQKVEEINNATKNKRKSEPFVRRRRAIKDPSGRVLIEEVLVDSLEELL